MGPRVRATSVFLFCWMALHPALQAQEALYIANQKPGQGLLTVDFSLATSSFARQSSEIHALGVEYRHALSKQRSLWIASSLLDRTSIEGSPSKIDGTGLSDISVGFKTGEVYDLLTSVYGVSASVSPGPLNETGFSSGTHRIAPFWGFESYSEHWAIGAQAELRLSSDLQGTVDPKSLSSANPRKLVPRFSAFAESPLMRHLDLGFHLAFGRPDFAFAEYLTSPNETEYEFGIYAQWKYDPQTAVILRSSLKNLKYPLSDERFDVGVGLRRQL